MRRQLFLPTSRRDPFLFLPFFRPSNASANNCRTASVRLIGKAGIELPEDQPSPTTVL